MKVKDRPWLDLGPDEPAFSWGDWGAIGLIALIFTLSCIAILAGLGAMMRFL